MLTHDQGHMTRNNWIYFKANANAANAKRLIMTCHVLVVILVVVSFLIVFNSIGTAVISITLAREARCKLAAVGVKR